ncbi:hypothetical protein Q0812_13180 [Brevundimonas sp. 2R-24]|uniref:Uncharacterized protein n=1 Tax=Peiella sedimenti TaxID=3061083 RepID=A0ABT8SP70_9CAUL|nr:hypothetical protein [Caulobacteraceae bacterium XZ-24]
MPDPTTAEGLETVGHVTYGPQGGPMISPVPRARWPNAFEVVRRSDADQAIRALEAERDEARAELAQLREDADRWFIRMAAIREAAGIGATPMLAEVPDAIRAVRVALEAKLAAAEAELVEMERRELLPLWALIRAAGGEVRVSRDVLQDAGPDIEVERFADPMTGDTLFRAGFRQTLATIADGGGK